MLPLQGLFKAVRGDVKPVAHLDGGVYGWYKAAMPMVSCLLTETLCSLYALLLKASQTAPHLTE